MSQGAFTQADLDSFIASLQPAQLVISALKEYFVPLLLAVVVLVPPTRKRLGDVADTARYLPLGTWALVFCLDLLPFDTTTRWIWTVRFSLVSMLAVVPVLAAASVPSGAPARGRSWAFGALVGFGTVLCDWGFLVLLASPIPEIR